MIQHEQTCPKHGASGRGNSCADGGTPQAGRPAVWTPLGRAVRLCTPKQVRTMSVALRFTRPGTFCTTSNYITCDDENSPACPRGCTLFILLFGGVRGEGRSFLQPPKLPRFLIRRMGRARSTSRGCEEGQGNCRQGSALSRGRTEWRRPGGWPNFLPGFDVKRDEMQTAEPSTQIVMTVVRY